MGWKDNVKRQRGEKGGDSRVSENRGKTQAGKNGRSHRKTRLTFNNREKKVAGLWNWGETASGSEGVKREKGKQKGYPSSFQPQNRSLISVVGTPQKVKLGGYLNIGEKGKIRKIDPGESRRGLVACGDLNHCKHGRCHSAKWGETRGEGDLNWG